MYIWVQIKYIELRCYIKLSVDNGPFINIWRQKILIWMGLEAEISALISAILFTTLLRHEQ